MQEHRENSHGFEKGRLCRITPGKELWTCTLAPSLPGGDKYRAKISNDEATQRQRIYFEREAIVATIVKDAGVTPPEFVGWNASQPFIVYRDRAGLEFSDFCREHTPPLAVRLWILRQVAHSLRAIHAKGFIHGNVRSEHIWIDGHCQVTLCGLGTCEVTGSDVRLNRELREGDPPEASTKHEACSSRDIFSFGILVRAILGAAIPTSIPDAMLHRRPALRPNAQQIAEQLRQLEIRQLAKHFLKAA